VTGTYTPVTQRSSRPASHCILTYALCYQKFHLVICLSYKQGSSVVNSRPQLDSPRSSFARLRRADSEMKHVKNRDFFDMFLRRHGEHGEVQRLIFPTDSFAGLHVISVRIPSTKVLGYFQAVRFPDARVRRAQESRRQIRPVLPQHSRAASGSQA